MSGAHQHGAKISLEYGKALRGYNETGGRYRVFGSNGPIGWTSEPLAPGPGVILGRKGAYRGVHYSPKPFFVIDTAYYVVPKSEIDMRWLYYAIAHYKLGEVDDGSPIPSTTRAAVYMLDLDVPPPEEQHAIANILGTLDDKIELNRRMNETLEAMARAIFKSWFVDFDPVRAKAEGRDPGLPKHIADLFPDSLEDSELGEIPAWWCVANIDAHAQVTSGKIPQARFSEPSDDARVPFWGGNGPMGFVATPLYERHVLLTGRVGTLGSVFRITSACWPSDNTLVVLAKDERFHEFLYFQLKQVDFVSLNRGSTQPLLTQTDLKTQKFALPPINLIDRFHSVVRNLFSRVDALQDESRTVGTLRDTLLPKLISGELRVQNANPILEGVVS